MGKNAEYDRMVKQASPDSPVLTDCLKAFVAGGLICIIGQFLNNFALARGFDGRTAATITSITLIVAASLLTGLGIYSKIGKWAGAGSIVPITGFSNSVTSPAVEYKREGWIMGLGSKIFTIAGPVILYGVLTSMAVGLVYYFTAFR